MRGFLSALLLTACGNVTGEAPDGGTDVPDARPASGPVTLTFLEGGAIVANAPIVVYRPDGTVFIETTTSANGFRRIEDVPSGSTLMAGAHLTTPLTFTRLSVVIGVQPGDEITLGDRGRDETTDELTVAVSNYTASSFWIDDGCIQRVMTPSSSQTFDAAHFCRTPGTTTWNIVGQAQDADGNALAYAVYPGLSAGGTATLDQWRTDWGTFRLNVSNPPAGATGMSGALSFPHLRPPPFSYNTTETSGAWTFRFPQGTTSRMGYLALANSVEGSSSIDRVISAGTAQVTLNLAAILIPFIQSPVADLTDPVRPVISWSAPTENGADMLALHTVWEGPSTYVWVVYAPPGTPSPVSYPPIPASWGVEMHPPSGDAWRFFGAVNLIDNDRTQGWDGLRLEPAQAGDRRTSQARF
jgi:hypothetical protein